MTRILRALCCCVAICALVDTAYIPGSFFHDYVKDGRPVDGPFPSSLKNIPYYCHQVPLKGPCSRMYMVYFYDVVRRNCMPMLYSGCGGNENKFPNKQICQMHCESKRRI